MQPSQPITPEPQAPPAENQQPAMAAPVAVTVPQPPTPPEPQAIPQAAAPAPPPPDTISQIASQPTTESLSPREIYATICSQIIKEQGQIIGPLSYEQASHVDGLQVDPSTYKCVITGDGKTVLEALVEKYREFFGNAAVEVCREAASRLMAQLPSEEVPASLRS